MGPIWGRQDPGGPMNFAIWDITAIGCNEATEQMPSQCKGPVMQKLSLKFIIMLNYIVAIDK